MKNICFLLMSLFVGIAPVSAATFISGLEDVPLMDGLQQQPSDGISFGNEESRLVEVILSSPRLGFSQVGRFYRETLPQLGWTYQGKRGQTLVFEREGEVLDIALESDKPLQVRLTVKSKIE